MTRFSLRSQRGMSLVELIIGMAITSILLVGLIGVLFATSAAYTNWIDRIETSGTGDVLAAALIADSHHYTVCGGTADELRFCLPQQLSAGPIVTYESAEQSPYTITRIDRLGGQRVLVRGLPAPVKYQVRCHPQATTDTGVVSVRGLPARGDFRIYFVTASGGCQGT